MEELALSLKARKVGICAGLTDNLLSYPSAVSLSLSLSLSLTHTHTQSNIGSYICHVPLHIGFCVGYLKYWWVEDEQKPGQVSSVWYLCSFWVSPMTSLPAYMPLLYLCPSCQQAVLTVTLTPMGYPGVLGCGNTICSLFPFPCPHFCMFQFFFFFSMICCEYLFSSDH